MACLYPRTGPPRKRKRARIRFPDFCYTAGNRRNGQAPQNLRHRPRDPPRIRVPPAPATGGESVPPSRWRTAGGDRLAPRDAMTPVLLCLHGWGGSKESFSELREALKNTDIEILTPDLPGFGSEPEPDRPWTVDDYAEWGAKWFEQR